ncbi:HAD-IIIC family phosphatase [Affinibrenneria salicis]|uniref:HAD-IIIC family phosphatase n=1 Tax=Affinibrenneria salicis TaxID=2590031 RepID=A0A5J5FRJ0_9GAMM|nr:HAD-IIIC family phosphatase [Affinibrenneria salicis]KAA8995162.1 HAD-IIIC family phosphatase [Affinibrenneria salicis]
MRPAMKVTPLDKLIQSRKLSPEGKSSINIAVFSNYNHEAIYGLLNYNLNKINFFADFYECSYSDYFFHIMENKEEIKKYRADVHAFIIDDFFVKNSHDIILPLADIKSNIRQLREKITLLMHFSIDQCQSHTLINTVNISEDLLKQFISRDSRRQVNEAIAELNDFIADFAQQYDSVSVIDIDRSISNNAINSKKSNAIDILADINMLDYIAKSICDDVRLIAGKALKCVVTDLDNTLWRGTLADDGIDRVVISGGKDGAAFLRYQEYLARLHDQGVILAICSKNDEQDVQEVFRARKDELHIGLHHFSKVMANWEKKSDNISRIASDLNISPEHIVFVDDSEYECAEVKNSLPEITTFNFSGDINSRLNAFICEDFFIKETITQSDRIRNITYSQNKIRDEIKNNANSYDDFLNSLQLSLRARPVDTSTLDRVSEMTLRTNQFNMTTRRMLVNEIDAFLQEEGNNILIFECDDKVGNYGIVGCAFLNLSGHKCKILNVILSCRVFGRQVEYAIMKAIAHLCHKNEIKETEALYIPTKKNERFATFYTDCGFDKAGENTFFCSALDLELLKRKSNFITLTCEG